MAGSKERTSPSMELLQGTLDTLILRTVEGAGAEGIHGYAIARRIEAASGGRMTIEEGSLYPALRRLEKRGDVKAKWSSSETGRRARFYSLTAAGGKRLREATASWREMAEMMGRILGLSGRSSPATAVGGAG